jgi:Skp family chaperone for outer membrane proteins
MKRNYLVLLGILAAAAMAALVPVRAQAPQGAPARVAVCSPRKVMNTIQEAKDLQQQNEATGKNLVAERTQRESKLKDMQQALQLLKSDSPGYADKVKELETATVEYEVWVKVKQFENDRTVKTQTKQLWEKVTATVAEVAMQKGYDIVLADARVDIPDDLTQLTDQQLNQVIQTRNVLFVAAQVDVTQDVIAAMDAKYKAPAAK